MLFQSGSKHTSKRSWIPRKSFEADISPVIDCTTTTWWALLKKGRTQEKLLHPAATEHYWKYRLGEAPYHKEFMKGEPKRKGYIQLIPNPVHQNRSGRAPATKIPKLVPKPHPKVLIRIILFLRSPSTPAAPPPNPDHHHHCTLFELSCTLLPEPGTTPTTSRALQLTGVLAKRKVEKIEAFCCHCSFLFFVLRHEQYAASGLPFRAQDPL